MNIYITHIEHAHGHDLRAFLDQDSRDSYLYDWVTKNWEKEWGELPDTHEECFDAYFDTDGNQHTEEILRTEYVTFGDPQVYLRVEGGIVQGWSSDMPVNIIVYDADNPEEERPHTEKEWEQLCNNCKYQY